MRQKPQTHLTPEEAAAVAGMSRPAFLKHVAKGDIQPAITVNKRSLFLIETVKQWATARRKNGAKKRGYPPKNGNKKSTSRKDT